LTPALIPAFSPGEKENRSPVSWNVVWQDWRNNLSQIRNLASAGLLNGARLCLQDQSQRVVANGVWKNLRFGLAEVLRLVCDTAALRPALFKRQRRDIFVESQWKQNQAPLGAAYSAPMGLGDLWRVILQRFRS
jgi:hypothetical protein